jgi:hypothetical protein
MYGFFLNQKSKIAIFWGNRIPPFQQSTIMDNIQTSPQQIKTPAREKFLKQIRNPWKFQLFQFMKLPAAFRSGVRLDAIDYEQATASVPYKRFTQNPFRSTYFAVLSMAAELSTGVLALLAIEGIKPSVAMLVKHVEGDFSKKATGRTFFTCEEGARLREAVAEALRTGEGVTARVLTIGRNEAGEEVARFHFTWTFKQRKKRG